jgi:hypothetical protein
VPVGELADVVGFRSVTTADVLVGGHAVVGDFTMRRDVRDALDAQRWIDDGGSAVVAVALPTSDRRLLPNAGAPGQNGTP